MSARTDATPTPFRTELARFTELRMRTALMRAFGNQSEAAGSIGMTRPNFCRLLQKFNRQLDAETDRVRPVWEEK